MSKVEDNIDLVNDKIESEVTKFLAGVDKSESGIFNRTLSIVKELETNPNGSIKQTVKNLKLLARVRKTIENEVITDAYIKRVGTLNNQFPAIAELNNGYFDGIAEAFNPNRELYKEIVKNSVNSTKASLLESGIAENVINPIVNIVDNSVTNGSAFADMVDELRTIIKGDPERLGQLMRYSKQITQDALNQFNASYNETIAKDLDLEWYFYSGGRRKTSRPFCIKYAGRYFHKKEVEDFGRRKDLDGSNLCKKRKKNLCAGRIPRTNSSNIFRFRGGYNCMHIYKPTLIDSVPKSVIKRNLDKGYIKESDLDGIDVTKVITKEAKPIYKPTMSRKDAELFIKNSKIKEDVFHVTSLNSANEISKKGFNTKGKTGFGRVWGDAIYLARDNKTADIYKRLGKSTGNDKKLTIKVSTNNPISVDMTDVIDEEGFGVSLIERLPKKIQEDVKKLGPKFHKKTTDIRKNVPHKYKGTKLTESQIKDNTEYWEKHNDDFKYYDNFQNQVIESLKNNKYDALEIKATEKQQFIGGHQLLVFDSKNIIVIK